jgi:glutamine---fructose-6-phosphate transaminase (isomerizing)
MTVTYGELKQQYAALRSTFDYITSKKDEIISFFNEKSPKSLTYIGCGSGYCLCQSGEFSAKVRLGIPAATFAAGDLMLNCKSYSKILEGTMIMAPSRSGSTSEVIKAIENVKRVTDLPVFAITCVEDSQLSKIADFVLELPWAYDESVCQTRTVVNLYAANLLVLAYLSGDDKLVGDIDTAIISGSKFMTEYEGQLKEIAQTDWDYAVLLADGEMQGIANEGAIAFTEIANVLAHYFHLLDVRHGPMTLINSNTLVIASISQQGFEYQKALISDIIKRGAKVIIYSDKPIEKIEGVCLQVTSGMSLDNAVHGIPFIFLPQVLAYFKAEQKGINPDSPDGIVAWVEL